MGAPCQMELIARKMIEPDAKGETALRCGIQLFD